MSTVYQVLWQTPEVHHLIYRSQFYEAGLLKLILKEEEPEVQRRPTQGHADNVKEVSLKPRPHVSIWYPSGSEPGIASPPRHHSTSHTASPVATMGRADAHKLWPQLPGSNPRSSALLLGDFA